MLEYFGLVSVYDIAGEVVEKFAFLPTRILLVEGDRNVWVPRI